MKIGTALLALALTASPAAAVSYTNATLHCTFSLPDGWIEIPAATISERARQAASVTGAPEQKYDGGFQLANKPWFTYPYVLVQHFDAASPQQARFSRDMARAAKASPRTPANELPKGMDEPIADTTRHSMTTTFHQDVPGIGQVRAVSVETAGRAGLLELNFFAVESDFDAQWAAFQPSLNSLRFDDGFEYGDTASALNGGPLGSSTNLAEMASIVLGGALVALLGVLLFRKRLNRPPN